MYEVFPILRLRSATVLDFALSISTDALVADRENFC
jgi:hypothetical protein